MNEYEHIDLVRIDPIEYRPFDTYPCVVWYRNIHVKPNLTQRQLDYIAEHFNTKRKINITANPDHFLTWQVMGYPQVIIDLNKGLLYVTKGTLEHFGIGVCQQQVSIVLRALRKYRKATFKQVYVSTFRLGDTPDDRKTVLDAFFRLNCFRKEERESIKEGWIESEN